MAGVEIHDEKDAVVARTRVVTTVPLFAKWFWSLIAVFNAHRRVSRLAALLSLALSGFLVMGYHPGAEDDGVYLAAIKSALNPALYPHDADLFRLQLKATLFDTLVAASVRITGMPVDWAVFLWQIFSIILLVAAAWQLIVQLAEDACAGFGAVVLFTSLLTLPVAGTALYIADQYLHPRTIASAFILFGISRILAGSGWQAIPLIGMACMLHPLIGAYGASLCCVLAFHPERVLAFLCRPFEWRVRSGSMFFGLFAVPLGWIFDRPSPAVANILRSRHWYCLYDWTWYEWLGVVGPSIFFWLVLRLAHRRGHVKLARFSFVILVYGAMHLALAMVLLARGVDLGLGALEPMRYLHLVYISMILIGGSLLGKHVLRTSRLRWDVLRTETNLSGY